jgi:transitional endoplasmic reticulum ATPase
VFKIHTKDLPLAQDVDLDALARCTTGATGADIAALCRAALMESLRRRLARPQAAGAMKDLTVSASDFADALHAQTAASGEVEAH